MRAERLFRSPQLFRRNRPKIPCTWPNNPTRPASFLRQFSPQHSPVARLFRGKKGLFCPQRPPYPPFCPPERPVLPRRRPFFARRAPGWSPGLPRFCPGPRRPRTPSGPQKPPRVRLFCPPVPASARRAPPERPKVAPPAAETTPPCAASPPVAAVRRPKVAPPPSPRHTLGAGQPDRRGRLSRFAVKKCATPGGIRSLGMTGKRPPPPLA